MVAMITRWVSRYTQSLHRARTLARVNPMYYYTPFPFNVATTTTISKQASKQQQARHHSVSAITPSQRFGSFADLAILEPRWWACQIQVLSQEPTPIGFPPMLAGRRAEGTSQLGTNTPGLLLLSESDSNLGRALAGGGGGSTIPLPPHETTHTPQTQQDFLLGGMEFHHLWQGTLKRGGEPLCKSSNARAFRRPIGLGARPSSRHVGPHGY